MKSSPLLPHIHPSLIIDWSVKLTDLVVTVLPVVQVRCKLNQLPII